jgi:uncharacterized protein YndB with AHSA1/START domain
MRHHEEGRRSIELEFEVPGTPEQVWQAIATGQGISSWFAASEVEERVGGAVVFRMAPGVESSGTVTAWDPPVRFAYEEPDWSPPAPPLATEFVIEARTGGSCVVRLVHSLFASSDDWDDQMEGFEIGWAPLFKVMTSSPASEAETWSTLARALGLKRAPVGRRVASGTGQPLFSGTIAAEGEERHPFELLLRLDAPAHGTALIGAYTWGGAVHAMVILFLYGERASAIAARDAQSWQDWLSGLFPEAATSGLGSP